MFRLIRLATYALVGYAAYQIYTEIVSGAGEPAPRKRGNGGTRGGSRSSSPMTGQKRGGGGGRQETTQEPDGGGTRHRVGRGVV